MLRGETAWVNPPVPAGHLGITMHCAHAPVRWSECASGRPTGLAVGFGSEASRSYAPARRDSPLVRPLTGASRRRACIPAGMGSPALPQLLRASKLGRISCTSAFHVFSFAESEVRA